jgi:hypothetical protein
MDSIMVTCSCQHLFVVCKFHSWLVEPVLVLVPPCISRVLRRQYFTVVLVEVETCVPKRFRCAMTYSIECQTLVCQLHLVVRVQQVRNEILSADM